MRSSLPQGAKGIYYATLEASDFLGDFELGLHPQEIGKNRERGKDECIDSEKEFRRSRQ